MDLPAHLRAAALNMKPVIDMVAWWFSLLPVLAIGAVALLARVTQGSWVAPGAAWAGFWLFAAGAPLFVAPHYPVSPSALWVIFSFALVIWLGTLVGQHATATQTPRGVAARPVADVRMMRLLCLATSSAGLLATTITLSRYGVGWMVWLNPEALFAVSKQISYDRYFANEDESMSVRLLFAINYFSALAGGYAMAWRREGDRRLILFAPILSALFYALLTTAKAGLLFALILWVSSFMVEYFKRKRSAFHIQWKLVVSVGLGAFALGALFWLAMLMRYGIRQGDDREFMIERLRNYGFAHISVFSGWWESPERQSADLSLGRSSFFGPTAMLGLGERVQGAYRPLESAKYDIDSNVFTVHRSLIEDFGLQAGWGVAFAVAMIVGYSYRLTTLGGRHILPPMILTVFYTVLLWSHIINPLGYTSICVAFAGYLAVLAILRALARASRQRSSALQISHAPR